MSMNEYEKHVLKHNIMGMLDLANTPAEAIDMAMDLREPMFNPKLKIKRRDGGVSGEGGGGAGGGSYGPAGGDVGGATGG